MKKLITLAQKMTLLFGVYLLLYYKTISQLLYDEYGHILGAEIRGLSQGTQDKM